MVKIQYTELKLSCGNDPVVKNYIYSNGDLDLWPNDPKINMVLPLPQALFILGSLPLYRLIIYIDRRILWCTHFLFCIYLSQVSRNRFHGKYSNTFKNYIYSNGDLDLWPNDPKINMVLPLPQGKHVAKFGQDPIYRTKVIMWKRPCCQKFYL
jgi:hypothetical protein